MIASKQRGKGLQFNCKRFFLYLVPGQRHVPRFEITPLFDDLLGFFYLFFHNITRSRQAWRDWKTKSYDISIPSHVVIVSWAYCWAFDMRLNKSNVCTVSLINYQNRLFRRSDKPSQNRRFSQQWPIVIRRQHLTTSFRLSQNIC